MTEYNNGHKAFTTAEAITAYRRVKLNSSKLLVYADADDKGIGTAAHTAASGDLCTVILDKPTRLMVATGAIALLANVYTTDDGKVDDDPTAGLPAGIALQAAGAAGDRIEVLPDNGAESGSALLYKNTADSTTVTNTVTETAFDLSKTIDGAGLKAGDVLEIMARAYVSATNSTDTLTLKLKVGTETIVATAAVDVANGDVGYLHAFVTVRAAGASGSLSASGVQALGVPGTVAALPFRMDAASEDLSGDVAVTVTATWSVANAGNVTDLEDLLVLHHRR